MAGGSAGAVPLTGGRAARDRRVLYLPATARDAELAVAAVAPAGVVLQVCRSFDDLLQEAAAGAGALLLPEEAASNRNNAAMRAMLAAQPPWSDLPVLVLTRPGANSAESSEAVRTFGNVTLLERPVRVATLLSAIRTALRGRERQYQLREHLAERARGEASLRRADQRKDEFLATLGHELRNPLAPLLTALHLLKTRDVSDPIVLRVSEVMDRQISHLVRLVDDLLEVSRITRGLVAVRREVIDLAAVVQAAVDTSAPAIAASEHRLTVDLPDTPVTVRGDAVRLTQVFANLLTNAAKYTDAGGEVRVRLERNPGQARVTVSDNGIGIAPEQLGTVFEMFTQVDRSSRRTQGGLGIGLTLVRSLVQLHGGRVEARSAGLGQGSDFVVTLPTVEMAATATADRPEVHFDRHRILVVDDNQDAAETLGELLRTLGAVVVTAHSGPDALAAFAAHRPDVVLLDLGLPGMDGFEVARRLRADAGNAVQLIAVSGWGQEGDRRRARLAGFDHHLVKPPDIEQLHRLLEAAPAPARPVEE